MRLRLLPVLPRWLTVRSGLISLVLVLAVTLIGQQAWAAEPGSSDPGGPGLDQLLKLPRSVEFSTENKGGATRNEWRQRFHDARASVKSAEVALAKAQNELAEVAGSKDDWQFSPPGLPAEASTDSGSSIKLRQEVKRTRGEVERSKSRLRELDVEANLAGVPDEWRDPSTEARSGHESVTGTLPSP